MARVGKNEVSVRQGDVFLQLRRSPRNWSEPPAFPIQLVTVKLIAPYILPTAPGRKQRPPKRTIRRWLGIFRNRLLYRWLGIGRLRRLRNRFLRFRWRTFRNRLLYRWLGLGRLRRLRNRFLWFRWRFLWFRYRCKATATGKYRNTQHRNQNQIPQLRLLDFVEREPNQPIQPIPDSRQNRQSGMISSSSSSCNS